MSAIRDADRIIGLLESKEGVERTARGVAAGGTCAVVGGVVGGVLAAAFTGGLGAAGGAAIGAAIGGAIGGTAGAIAPVSDAKEIIYFRFENASSFYFRNGIAVW